MRRREFIALLGGAAIAWPFTGRAQQPAMPVIGYLGSATAEAYGKLADAFRQGLGEAGYVAGRNVAIEYRYAEGQYERLPALAADLVARQVAVIAAQSGPAALAAKSVTATIPIVFSSGVDPVTFGLVDSFNRPGGNATGIYFLTASLEPKRLELLHELLPKVAVIAFLVNPNNANAEALLRDTHQAARTLGLELRVLQASNESETSRAFESAVEQRIGALVVGSDPFFNIQREQIVALAARHGIPAIYPLVEFATAGGLMSYGTSLTDAARQAGVYTGRILKGEKPADLPVQQSTKVELVINLKTAKALGLEVPLSVLMRVNEVIE